MPNAFTRLFGARDMIESTPLIEAEMILDDVRSTNINVTMENERLQESMRELSLFLEDLNWIPVEGYREGEGFKLDTIKEQADRARALLTVNPIIKKASNARIGYIWGKGVAFEGAPKQQINDPYNQQEIFSDFAHEELERILQTDGNIFAARSKNSSDITLIPLGQIAGWITAPGAPNKVSYWLWEYTETITDFRTGIDTPNTVHTWIPAEGQTGTVTKIQEWPVDRTKEMIHKSVNRQKGWILGLPDIIAVMFWAKAHKELFEAGTTFVKAQGKFASKVVAKTQAGAQRSAAAVAEAPRRDPESGEVLDIGGTAVMSAGLDMQLMGKMSGGVDFNVFEPVLGLVAAGFDVPLSVLTATAAGEEDTLELSVVTAAQSRQKLWTEFFRGIFGRQRNVTVTWPRIKVDSTYRQVQAIEIANNTNSLSQKELRQLSLEAFEITGDPNAVPPIEENPQYAIQAALLILQGEIAAKAADKAAEAAAVQAAAASNDPNATPENPSTGTPSKKQTTPEQGKDAGIGKLSNGADAKTARDKGEIASTKK